MKTFILLSVNPETGIVTVTGVSEGSDQDATILAQEYSDGLPSKAIPLLTFEEEFRSWLTALGVSSDKINSILTKYYISVYPYVKIFQKERPHILIETKATINDSR